MSDNTGGYDAAYTQPVPQPAAPQKSNGLAVASMVLGLTAWIPIVGWITGILAIIFGAQRLRHGAGGRGMAIAGFVLGIVFTVLWVVWVILGVAGV